MGYEARQTFANHSQPSVGWWLLTADLRVLAAVVPLLLPEAVWQRLCSVGVFS